MTNGGGGNPKDPHVYLIIETLKVGVVGKTEQYFVSLILQLV